MARTFSNPIQRTLGIKCLVPWPAEYSMFAREELWALRDKLVADVRASHGRNEAKRADSALDQMDSWYGPGFGLLCYGAITMEAYLSRFCAVERDVAVERMQYAREHPIEIVDDAAFEALRMQWREIDLRFKWLDQRRKARKLRHARKIAAAEAAVANSSGNARAA